jgi:hypothetical protein
MNIIGVVDLDGFFVEKNFFCRELGIIAYEDTYGTSFHFKTELSDENLNEKDRINAKFLQRNVHGLSLSDDNGLELNMIDVIVKKFYTSYKLNSKSVLAYKGGQIEKDLLEKLNIPSVNLEFFGCPKAKDIYPEMIWLESCGEHNLLRNKTNVHEHCPKVEVEAYLHWLTKNCK